MPQLRDRTAWLQGDPYRCLQPPAASAHPWRLVLLGPPGVGKGTQAELLASALGACPLSTADVFRAACERSFPPGSAMAEARARMDRGELVPDDVVLGLVRNRHACLRCRGGFLLDGFPRTLTQAVALDGLLASDHQTLDAVICYELSLAALIKRMTGRRVCVRCQALYHVKTRPPRREGVCDHCGGALHQRADDRPAAVRMRLHAYAAATAMVANYYARDRLLLRVDAGAAPEEILLRTLELLAARGFSVPAMPAPLAGAAKSLA